MQNIPEPVRYIIKTLKKNGCQAFLVGGCVRDEMLGRPIADYDIATNAVPNKIISIFPKHVASGIEYGTITVVTDNQKYDVTTFRTETNYSRPPPVKKTKKRTVAAKCEQQFVGDIYEDLRRRDFTVNALAYDLETGLIDRYDGVGDMNRQIIKCVGDPDTRSKEDPLRMLRAIRFSCKLNFTIEAATFDAIIANAHLINTISHERIREEICKILTFDCVRGINLLHQSQLLSHIISEINDTTIIVQRLSQTRTDTLDESHEKNMLIIRLAILFIESSSDTLKKFRFPRDTQSKIEMLLQHREQEPYLSKLEMKMFVIKLGVDNMYLLYHFRSIINANVDNFRTFLEIINNGEPLFLRDLAITGTDLIRDKALTGKELGQCMTKLMDAVLENPDWNTKETLLSIVR